MMKKVKITLMTIILILIFLITGIIIGNYISGKSFGKKLFLTPYNKVDVILDIIHKEYVDPININEMTENTIFQILKILDPYSFYFQKKNKIAYTAQNKIVNFCNESGIEYFFYKDTIVISNVMDEGPISKINIRPGDRILSINKSSNNFFSKKIKNFTKLKILRKYIDNIKIFDVEIEEKKILTPTIKIFYEIKKGIGFIKIQDIISHYSYNEFLKAVKKLLKIGCNSFILDLRMNKGGSYQAAIQIINEFFSSKKLIVYAKGNSFHFLKSVSNGKGILKKNPIIILIDNLSASASELIAGAIQDNDRGLIIGTPSFGKGLIQDQIEFSDGSMINLTVARYYLPSGRNIQRIYVSDNTYNNEFLKKNFLLSTTSVYHTLHGRPVYGKSGITPDIIIKPNTYLTYYHYLENNEIFTRFAFEYSDTNRKKLANFKNYLSMLDYLKTQPLLKEITLFALKNGIRKRTISINHSVDQILNTTYAWILGNFFKKKIFYSTFFKNDQVINCAIQAIENGYTTPELITSMQYKKIIFK